MRTRLIYNARAGAGGKEQELLEEAERHGLEVLRTGSSGDARRLAEEAVRAGAPRLLVGGGDGTVHEVVNGIACALLGDGAGDARRVELGVVPLGTGNDLARSLGLPARDVRDAVRLAATGRAHRADLIRFRAMQGGRWGETRWAINAAVGGVGARVAHRVESDEKTAWGPLAYWKAGLAELRDPPEFEAEIVVDGGEAIRADVRGIAVTNGRYAGGGVQLSDGVVDDGRLDVVALPVQTVWEDLAAGVEALLGQHSASEHLITVRGRRVAISSRPPMDFTVDGEPVACERIEFESVPGVLWLVMAEGAAVAETGIVG